METETPPLSAQQSLEIITRMIAQAKGNVQRNAFYFLLWGWIVALANTGMYILIKMQYPHPYVVWSITLPAWIFTMIRSFRRSKTEQSSTHLDRISGWLWLSFGVCVFTIVAFGWRLNFQINPLILLISAIPTFVSGIILRFKPLMIGGILFWTFAVTGFLVATEVQFLIGAVAIVCGYLIPGYMLRQKESGNV